VQCLVEQRGRLRLGAGKSWMDFSPEQFYTTSPPGFRWDAKFKIVGLQILRAVDSYNDGYGHMYGRLAGSPRWMNGLSHNNVRAIWRLIPPAGGAGVWHLPGGDLTDIELEITAVKSDWRD